MKLTKSKLKEIIREEIQRLNEEKKWKIFFVTAMHPDPEDAEGWISVGKNKDDGTLKHTQVSMIKRNNVNVARECAKLSRSILGANGITSDYPIMRHMMNIESVYTYEGTDEMHILILGHDITGIPAYK